MDGRIGPMPDWVRYMMAARWMKIAPWELAATEDPEFWIQAVGVITSAQAEERGKTTP